MKFSRAQLIEAGERAKEFTPSGDGYLIEVEATNLNDGTTISMEGRNSRKQKVTFLVNRRGDSSELTALLHGRTERPATAPLSVKQPNRTAKRESRRKT